MHCPQVVARAQVKLCVVVGACVVKGAGACVTAGVGIAVVAGAAVVVAGGELVVTIMIPRPTVVVGMTVGGHGGGLGLSLLTDAIEICCRIFFSKLHDAGGGLRLRRFDANEGLVAAEALRMLEATPRTVAAHKATIEILSIDNDLGAN